MNELQRQKYARPEYGGADSANGGADQCSTQHREAHAAPRYGVVGAATHPGRSVVADSHDAQQIQQDDDAINDSIAIDGAVTDLAEYRSHRLLQESADKAHGYRG